MVDFARQLKRMRDDPEGYRQWSEGVLNNYNGGAMLTEEVDAKLITREMVARQAAEEATTWVVEDGTYEATVSKYEEVPEDKLFDSERNAGVRAYNVDFQAYDVPGKASKVQGIRFQTGAVQNDWGTDKAYDLTMAIIGVAEAYDATTVSGQLEQALDWARTNRVKIRVGNNKPNNEEKLTAFMDAGKKVRNKVFAIKKA